MEKSYVDLAVSWTHVIIDPRWLKLMYGLDTVHEYVIGEAKFTEILSIYHQASGFPGQSSEYAFECR